MKNNEEKKSLKERISEKIEKGKTWIGNHKGTIKKVAVGVGALAVGTVCVALMSKRSDDDEIDDTDDADYTVELLPEKTEDDNDDMRPFQMIFADEETGEIYGACGCTKCFADDCMSMDGDRDVSIPEENIVVETKKGETVEETVEES